MRLEPSTAAVSPFALSMRHAFESGPSRQLTALKVGGLDVEAVTSEDSLWLVIRRPGAGGLALRAAYLAGPFKAAKTKPEQGEALRVQIESVMGKHVVAVSTCEHPSENIRVTVRLTPSTPLVIPFMPRDLYPLGKDDDPLAAKGVVEASQRGLNGGVLYFRLEEPAFGNVLYFQNLTAMNDYYRATQTSPDGAVGGEWPELGYLAPTPPAGAASKDNALPAGVETTLSDAILVIRSEAPNDERRSALQFLQMLGVAYKAIDRPVTEYRDWVGRAEAALRDLDEAPEATIKHYGHRYIHPYTDAEYPDSMVQLSLISAIHDWGKWRGEPHPLETDFRSGLSKFYDPKLKTLRRYLPNVGDDKDADAVDSWYLYHPMLNLGNLALDGDNHARDLLLKSIEFGIKAAHHFKYKWPIQYNVTDFSVITDVAGADGRGQTDVGGVYAWVMLQAFELTDDKRFLDEARAAIDAAMDLRFNLNYQANLTAWGAAACVRLWRITNKRVYLDQSYVYLASFFHNCEIWKSELKLAAHYDNFLGVTCLQDAPYMAMYECFESFAAFERYLNDSGPELDPEVRMLISEYCKYALHRAWFYYPDALPPEVISPKQRESNGHIDRKLSFPLEDLYPDGQQAGQVGQEVYGAGAAFVFASRAFHNVEGAPFRLYCNHFIRAIERVGERSISLVLDGGDACEADFALVRLKRRKLPGARLVIAEADALRPYQRSDDRIEYRVPASGRLLLSWDPK